MPIHPTRRQCLAGLAAVPILGPVAARSEVEGAVTGDVALGAEDAPVTVIEYASLTCPHCADFHRDTWPKVKAEYVDTGRVRFVLREVYFDRFGLWASMVARCGGRDGFYPIAGQFLKRQEEWTGAEDVTGAIVRIGRVNGLSSERINACLGDRSYAETLVAQYQENAEADGIESTPSFVINGELHRGNMPFEEFAAIIEGHLDGS